MEMLGYTSMVPVSLHELISKEKRDQWIRQKGFVVITFIDSKKPFKQVDIFLTDPVNFEDVHSRKKVINVCG